jgi:hypothetical protein
MEDVEIIQLAQLFHVLPSQIASEHPEWIWKIRAVLEAEAELSNRESRKRAP